MAIYEVNRVDSTIWGADGNHSGFNGNFIHVTDNDDSDDEWAVGEAVTARLFSVTNPNGYTDLAGHYRGTVTIEGVEYPVIEVFGEHFALGTGPTTSENSGGVAPHTISSALDTSGSFTVCFFPGTLIATPSGERRVEDLVPGDLVMIEDPGAVPLTSGRSAIGDSGCKRAVPVKWLGRQTVSTRFGPAKRLMPVRFAAGSLGGGGHPFCRIAT